MRFAKSVLLLSMPLLSSCQYVSYYKTNTTRAPMEYQESAEVVCSAIGSARGDISFDRCVAEEEDRADRKRQRDAGE